MALSSIVVTINCSQLKFSAKINVQDLSSYYIESTANEFCSAHW